MKTKILEKYKAIATEIYRSNPNIPDAGLSHFLLKDMVKAGFDPNQPRNVDGTWGSVGGSFENSTVKDKNGKLKPVYHITTSDFDEFDPKMGAQGVIWFTESKDKILSDATGAALRPGLDRILYEVNINIENPAGWDEYDKYSFGELIQMGYDGVKLEDDYVVFEPEQIKIISKTNPNKGQKAGFDPNQPRAQDGRWGSVGGDTLEKLKEDNKSTLPKIRTNKVFKNDRGRLDWGETSELDKLIESNSLDELPLKDVNVDDIYPTQLNINIDNLERVSDASLDNDDAAILFQKGNKYYVIDGHHRIARDILNGNDTVNIRVYESK